MKHFVLLLFIFLNTVIPAQSLFTNEIKQLFDPVLKPFYFGVASGDPQQYSVIIWTKVWDEFDKPIKVRWEISGDTLMQTIIASGEFTADTTAAYTVKILVKDLQPNTNYFYRFSAESAYSPIGRTKTAPVSGVDSLRFAVVSCNNYQGGYFNAYRLLAARNDLNAVIHLGDYIYEYGLSMNKKKPAVRNHIPPYEIINQQDYRSRYAQYRLDKDLQEVHRLHPFIAEWDDHEFANNTYKEGAQNHQPGEGDWPLREAIAKKVYFEWIPITDNAEESVIRKMSYGNLADLFTLDSRTEARSKQLSDPLDPEVNNAERTMLGKKQSDWLLSGLENSSARWKVICNQVVFSELDAHQLSKKYARNLDAWDGYAAERKDILDSFYLHKLKNLIVITGDIHSSFAFDLVQNPKDKNRYNSKTGSGVIGAEFVAPSVTSASLAERIPRTLAKIAGRLIKNKNANPHLRYNNLVDHGYMLLDLNMDRAKATWYFCKTIRSITDKYSAKNSWSTRYDKNRLIKEK